MSTKILIICAVTVIVIVFVGVFVAMGTGNIGKPKPTPESNLVTIAMSSSRPGCETTDSCYVKSQTFVNSRESVTWVNEDSAFHTVTSGHYDQPDGIFDSGQLDPAQKFSHTFTKSG